MDREAELKDFVGAQTKEKQDKDKEIMKETEGLDRHATGTRTHAPSPLRSGRTVRTGSLPGVNKPKTYHPRAEEATNDQPGEQLDGNTAKEGAEGPRAVAESEVRGDHKMLPRFIQSLLLVFCHTFQSTMIPSMKRASLDLIRKILHYLHPTVLEQVSPSKVANAMAALSIILDLMAKARARESKLLEHFAKPGVYSNVHLLCKPQEG